MFDKIADQRRRIADQLSELDADQWSTPSRCDGWTVQDVAGHLTTGWNVSLPKFALGMLKARGNFNKANERFGKELGDRAPEVIIADIRENADHRFTPPGAGPEASLSDCLVHSFDMFDPLGIEFERDPEVVHLVMDAAVQKGAASVYGTDVAKRFTLQATDVDWTHDTTGQPVIEAPVYELLLLAAGRRSPSDFD